MQIKSTSNQTNSQSHESNFEPCSETVREGEHTFAENSFSDSYFDSLDVYEEKPPKNGILEKLVCLQKMFKEIKTLRSL